MTQPTPPLGMSDFLALEAGEYLERLDALLAAEGAPTADEFVRLARALRGSALMANQQAIARAAGGLESVARAVREGRRRWDPATQQLAIRAVDDLKIFVRRAGSWTDADTAKAQALAAQLDHAAGRPSGQARAAEAPGLDAGARAFVAREGAAIASALDRAAQTLTANPLAHDPLQQVLRALQPLRGLAALNDLPPLPDLLEGIERAIAELATATAARSGSAPVGALFQAGASAIAQAAREVAERGRPDAEGAAFKQFAGLLVRLMDGEPDVMPIERLFHTDQGPHVVHRGTPAARPAMLGRLELVSHGEHLRQAADSLERAPSATQRELRAHTLAGTFRVLAGGGGGGGPLAEAVARFALAARDAVMSGVAVREAAAFAADLRRAGDVLARSASADEAALAAEVDMLAAAVRTLYSTEATGAAVAGPVTSGTAATAEESPTEPPDLAGSWAAYQRLVGAGVRPASLEELLSAAAGVSAASAASAASAVLDIRTLLYRGDRALRRAQELREQARGASGEQLRALVDEVCDLVALALEPELPTPPSASSSA